MRLTDFKKNTIKDAAINIFGPDIKIFLFGSRADDSIKGGDIDPRIAKETGIEI